MPLLPRPDTVLVSISRSEVYKKHLFYNTIGVKILTGHIKVSKLWMEFLFKFLMVYKVHVHIFRDDDKKQNMHVLPLI